MIIVCMFCDFFYQPVDIHGGCIPFSRFDLGFCCELSSTVLHYDPCCEVCVKNFNDIYNFGWYTMFQNFPHIFSIETSKSVLDVDEMCIYGVIPFSIFLCFYHCFYCWIVSILNIFIVFLYHLQ